MDDDNKDKLVKLPKRLADSLNDILGKNSESLSFVNGLFDIFRPFVNEGRERDKRQVILKEEYRQKINKNLEQLGTPEEKLLALQSEITRIDGLISEYKIRNYSGLMKHFLSIRNDILMPIKSNLKEEVQIRKLLPSVAPAKVTIKKRDKVKPIEKAKLDIDPVISKKVIDHLIGLKKFLEGDRLSLFNAFYCEDIAKKIIWFGNSNVWLTILYELQVNNKIKSNKKELSNWVVKYFKYKGKKGICDFNYKSVYETLNQSHASRRVHHTNPNYIDIMSLFE